MDDGHGKNKRRRGSDEAMPPPPPPLPSITYKDPIDTPKKTLFRSPTPLPKLRIDELAHPPPPSNGMGIRVYLRIRHVDPSENAGETCIFKASDTAATLHAPQSGGIRAGEVAKFSFTKVFDSDVPQQQIFEDSALPLAKGLLQRKSGLLFAYGVTNAGKTYTVVGPPHDPGVLPRTLDFLFTRIKNIHLGLEPPPDDSPAADDTKPQSPDVTYSVTISYCEIYNENIFDLLCDTKGARKKLDLKEDTENGGFYIKDMKEIQVASAEEAQNFIRRGMHNRKMANNTINADSSRSHTICTLKVFQTVSQTDGGEPLGYWSRMSIVDLAGAERNKRTGNTGERFNESNKINTSLMNLGRCLEILRSNQQHPHAPQQVIPFRNSKLTRIFRDFLLGAGQTVMVVNVNPHEVDFDETAHALKYTAVAREIVFSNRIDTHMVPMTPVRSPKKTPFATARRKPDPEPENTCEEDIDVLRRRLCETETRAARLESEIRDEVSREMAERLQEMEKMFQRRLVEEVAQREEKLRRQFDIRKRENLHRNAIIDATTPRKGSTSSGENDPFSWEIRQQYEDTISSLRERLGEQEKRYLELERVVSAGRACMRMHEGMVVL